jgi:Winged helix-turn helix
MSTATILRGGSSDETVGANAVLDLRRQEILLTLLREVGYAATIREAAAEAGVSPATIYRWQSRCPELRQALAYARERGRELLRWQPEDRPPARVRWRRDCPLCRARVVVRTTRSGVRFWRCGCWPHCPWASWRPRAPRNCKRCGGPWYWSCSRKSIGCPTCGVRVFRH